MTTEPTPSGARVVDRLRRLPRRWVAMISVLTIAGAAVTPWAVAQTITSNGVGRRLTGVIQACADRQTGALRLVASGDQVAAAPIGDFCTVNEEPVYWSSSLGAGASQPTGPAVTSTGPAVTSTTAPANPTSTAARSATTTSAGATTSSRPTTTSGPTTTRVPGPNCWGITLTVSTPFVSRRGTVRGEVLLDAPAPSGGLSVRLASFQASPTVVVVEAGQRSALFSAIATPTADFGSAEIAVERVDGVDPSNACQIPAAPFTIQKIIATPVLESSIAVPGERVVGRLELGFPSSAAACTEARRVETGRSDCRTFAEPFSSDVSVVLERGTNVFGELPLAVDRFVIPAGSTSVPFSFVAREELGMLSLRTKSVDGDNDIVVLLEVVPLRVVAARFEPATVVAGELTTAIVRFNRPVPPGRTLLRQSSGGAFAAPEITEVPPGTVEWTGTFPTAFVSTSVSRPVQFGVVDRYETPWVNFGTQNLAIASLNLTRASSLNGPVLADFTVNATTLRHGETAAGTVRLSAPAPANGAVVTLQSSYRNGSSDPAFIVPSRVFIPSGGRVANFPIRANMRETIRGVGLNAVALPVEGEDPPFVSAFLRTAKVVPIRTARAPAPVLLSVEVESLAGRPVALVARWDRPDVYPSSRSWLTFRSTNTDVIASPNRFAETEPGASTLRMPLTVGNVASETVVDLYYSTGEGERLLRVRVPPLPQTAANPARAVARG